MNDAADPIQEGPQDGQPASTGIIRVTVVAGLATMLLGIAIRSNPPDPVNVPILSSDGRLFYLLSIGAAALVAVMAQRAERVREAIAASRSRYVGKSIVPAPATAWILPALAVIGAVLLIARHHRWQEIAAATLLAASGVFASLTVRENLNDQLGNTVSPARVAHVVLTIAVAFMVITLLFMFRMRTMLSGPAIMLVALLLFLQVHDGIDTWPIRKLAYAVLGALALAQFTWALNYWPPIGWYAGAILTAVFAGMTFVTGGRLTNTLTRERAIVYATATAATVLLFTGLSW
jgi:hypothetical protein